MSAPLVGGSFDNLFAAVKGFEAANEMKVLLVPVSPRWLMTANHDDLKRTLQSAVMAIAYSSGAAHESPEAKSYLRRRPSFAEHAQRERAAFDAVSDASEHA